MQNPCKAYAFFKAIRGNWRNAVYVSCDCTSCPYGHNPACKGYLLAANEDGCPMVISENVYMLLTHESIDASECVGVISRQAFDSMYNLFFQWYLDSASDCPLHILGKFFTGRCS